MGKDAKTEFYYYINEKPYLLTPGKEGITEEIITILRDCDHAEHLNDRYAFEHQDPFFQCAQRSYNMHPYSYPNAPIDGLLDFSFSPEVVLFKKDLPPTIRERVHALIPQLIPSQQELFWKLSEGKKLVDIAKEEGTTDNAIRSRRRKMFKRLQALYSEIYGDQ